jgi:hypothetical protein
MVCFRYITVNTLHKRGGGGGDDDDDDDDDDDTAATRNLHLAVSLTTATTEQLKVTSKLCTAFDREGKGNDNFHSITRHEGREGEHPSFKLGAEWRGWLTPRPGRFTPENNPVLTVYEVRWT